MKILKYYLLFSILISLSVGCKKIEEPKITKATQSKIDRYPGVLMGVKSMRKKFYAKEFNKSEIQSYLLKTLRDDIWPSWEGTDWEFNGVSTEPGKGSIACGYFVMTTLEDAGFVCNRVKFSQQASSKIVVSICEKDKIKVFGNNDFSAFYKYVAKKKNQIYIVGLDNHVGFVLNDNGNLYAIHSSAWPHDAVVKERLEVAKAFRDSKIHYVGSVLESTSALKKWRVAEEFTLNQ